MSDNIFGSGDPAQTPPTQTPVEGVSTPVAPAQAQADPFSPLLDSIKGDDGQPKYRDVPTALNALQHSQEYIKQLKQQLEEATQKASQAVTMEQVLATLNKEKDAPQTPSVAPGVTPEDVLRIMQEAEVKKAHRANTEAVAKKFKELHGEKAEETFYNKAAEMGLTKQAINNLAATSPNAVFSMFGIKDSRTPAPSLPSGVNTSSMQESTPQSRTPVMGFKTDRELLEYWKNLKNEVESSFATK